MEQEAQDERVVSESDANCGFEPDDDAIVVSVLVIAKRTGMCC